MCKCKKIRVVIDIFLEKNYCEIVRNAARGNAVFDGGIMRFSFFKRTIFVLIVVLSVITAFALAGCEDKDGCTHVWNDGEITTATTCTQDGVRTFTCTLCGETRTEVVKSGGHVASETYVNTDPEGHYHVCSVCGVKTDDVQAHVFEDGEVIKQPSATEDGLQKTVCSVCGYESTKVLPPVTHTHVFDREVVDAKYLVSEATCEHKAVYYKSCECGEKGSETFEYGEYAAHVLDKTDRIEATCAEAGVEAYWTCSACVKLFSDENGTTEISAPVVIPATGEHEYVGEWQKDETGHWKVCECGALSAVEAHIPDKDAPTETEGVVCIVCGYEIEPATAHVHEPADQWSSDDTYHWHACDGCTQQLDKDVHVFADEHDKSGHWQECTVCGKKKDFAAHTPDKEAPTETEGVVCTVCGYEIEPATAHVHEPADQWSSDDTYHWHACGGCTQQLDKAEHVYDVQNASEEYLATAATCMNKATYYYSCECGAKGSETFESGEVAGHVFDKEVVDPMYLVSEATCTAKAVYYKSCVCGETGTETFEYGDLAEHTLVGGHNADVHYDECSVCHARFNESAHEWDGGVVTKKPTLTTEGEKTYTCACGETKVEKLAAQASFAADFTLEEEQPGPWSYGSIDYKWGEPEDFTFTQATAKNGGGDGWAAEGVEIKGGWINANNMMAVAYTVDSDVTVKVNLTFTGGTADTRLSLRTGVKNADGVIYGNPAYFDGGKQSNVLNYETTLELKAGDTVYFILGNENGANPAAYPNGGLDIVLTQVIG